MRPSLITHNHAFRRITSKPTDNHEYDRLSQSLQSNPMDTNQCIQLLIRMKSNQYKVGHSEMKSFSNGISKLISKCSHNANAIERIDAAIDQYDDIFIKTALINAYGRTRNVWKAKATFDSIRNFRKNIGCCNAMMTAYNNNGRFHEALCLYDDIQCIATDISHVLALKAVPKMARFRIPRFFENQDCFNPFLNSKVFTNQIICLSTRIFIFLSEYRNIHIQVFTNQFQRSYSNIFQYFPICPISLHCMLSLSSGL